MEFLVHINEVISNQTTYYLRTNEEKPEIAKVESFRFLIRALC